MARTVIGLFESADGTLGALQELANQRIPYMSIGIIANREEPHVEELVPLTKASMAIEAGMVLVILLAPADLADALDEIELPEADIQSYVEAVQRGEVLVSVEVDYSRFNQVWEILDRRMRKKSLLRGRSFLATMGTHGRMRGRR